MSEKFSNNICINTGSWCGDREVYLSLPGHWSIDIHNGSMASPLNSYQIEEKLHQPVDDFGLSSILESHHKVAIVIDDHTRPTPVADILIPLLKMIRSFGVENKNIKIIVALGTHLLDDRSFLGNKLGHLMDGDVEIIFPSCRESSQFVFVGDSDDGIPVWANRSFVEADVKMAISGIYPHDEAGFSGGAKILIGVLGLETITRFHRKHGLLVRGSAIDTDFRKELEHFADLVGLTYSINCVINGEKKVTDLYCGDFRKSFRKAVMSAKASFATQIDSEADVVISNAYPLDTSLSVLGKSKWPFKFYNESAYKIIVTSLCDCSGERVPMASSQKERLLQDIKRLTGASSTKRCLRELNIKARNLVTSDYKWKNKPVIHVAHIDEKYSGRPALINDYIVQYNWDEIINELLDQFGLSYPVRVAFFLYAPLLFPQGRCLSGSHS